MSLVVRAVKRGGSLSRCSVPTTRSLTSRSHLGSLHLERPLGDKRGRSGPTPSVRRLRCEAEPRKTSADPSTSPPPAAPRLRGPGRPVIFSRIGRAGSRPFRAEAPARARHPVHPPGRRSKPALPRIADPPDPARAACGRRRRRRPASPARPPSRARQLPTQRADWPAHSRSASRTAILKILLILRSGERAARGPRPARLLLSGGLLVHTRGEDGIGEARLLPPWPGRREGDAGHKQRGPPRGRGLASARLGQTGLARPGAAQAGRERAPAAGGRCGFPPRASPGRRVE